MKALVYTAPSVLEEQELDVPDRTPDQVLLRVLAAGVCGSDVNGYLGRSRRRIPPLVLGHEFSAVVEEAPEGSLRPGTRVAVLPLVGCGLSTCPQCTAGQPNRCPDRQLMGLHLPGAFAEYIVVPVASCYPIEDHVSAVAGASVEPLANAVHMFETVQRRHGLVGEVAILGAGGQGLTALLLGHHLGIDCHMIEPDAHRRELALQLGAASAVAPELADRAPRFAAVLDTAGHQATRQLGIEIAAPGGTVIMLGLHDEASSLPCVDIVNREVSVTGSYAYTASDFRRALALVTAGHVDPTRFFTELPSGAGVQAFERLVSRSDDLIKPVLLFDQKETR
ncbi:MAG TPA: alcohol dehydrogenase catalytic domain-containing protein [Mycobacteriales bacterium]